MPVDIPGEKLAIKLVETIETGIGNLLAPWQTRRMGIANAAVRRHEMLLIAQTERDLEDVRTGRKFYGSSGSLMAPPKSDSFLDPIAELAGPDDQRHGYPPAHIPEDIDLLTGLPNKKDMKSPDVDHAPAESLTGTHRDDTARLVQTAAIEREIKRAVNLKKIALAAEAEAEFVPDSAVSDRAVDPDWFAKWRSGAEDVTIEEMQHLWGRVLAGEVRQPGSYSIRTLEFLGRMAREDADLITSVARFVVDNFIYRGAREYINTCGVDSDSLLYLDELGVIKGVETTHLTALNVGISSSRRDRFEARLLGSARSLLIRGDSPNERIELPVYPVSRLGMQLLTLGTFEVDHGYLQLVGDAIKRRLPSFTVEIVEEGPVR